MAYMNASPRCFSKRNYPNCSLFYSKLMDHVFALDVNKLELGHLLSRAVIDLVSSVKFIPKSFPVRYYLAGTLNSSFSYSSLVCLTDVRCIDN